MSDSAGLGSGLRIGFTNKVPDEADAAVLRTSL